MCESSKPYLYSKISSTISYNKYFETRKCLQKDNLKIKYKKSLFTCWK